MSALEAFTMLLEAVPLVAFRNQYRPIKLVEMDLPKNIQALDLLYEIYWNQKLFIGFEEFYKKYREQYSVDLEIFRKKITMCEDCFYRGLPARIYRTWASIITQIHGGYVAESVFGNGTVSMSTELDHNGADFQVNYLGNILNYQVKKKTNSREVRTAKSHSGVMIGEQIDIKYEVPQDDYFAKPYRNDGTLRLPYERFIENKELHRLNNGFVVFTPAVFANKKAELDNKVN
jgi:hypothetical protein